MTKVSKLLASVAAFALAITGLTALPAQAADPYVVTEVKSGLDASADLVAANTRVYWKSGNQLWTSDGTTSLALHTFATSTSLSLTQASPQYTESGFFNYSTYINRAVTVGDTISFWAAERLKMELPGQLAAHYAAMRARPSVQRAMQRPAANDVFYSEAA